MTNREREGVWKWRAVLAIILVVGSSYAATARLPLFSDSYAHLGTAATFSGIRDCFRLDLVPLRPLQHLYFWVLNEWGVSSPYFARIPVFAMHGIAAWLVFRVVCALKASSRTAFWTTILFLTYPTIKATAWIAAIGWPGRLVCVLAGILGVLRHLDRPTRWSGVMPLVWFLLALAFHQSGFMLPMAYAALAWRNGVAKGFSNLATTRTLLRPWLGIPLLLSALYLVYLLVGRENRVHGVRSIEATVANGVRTILTYVPESIRTLAVDGLRWQDGEILWFVVGLGIVLSVVTAALVLFRLGPPSSRVWLAIFGAEIALPALTSAYSQRYSYVAIAFLLFSLVEALRESGRVAKQVLLVITSLLWIGFVADHVIDALEMRAAGTISESLIAQLGEARRESLDARITVVDTLYSYGRERDIPVLSYGLRDALRIAGIGGTWRFIRRESGWWGTDFESISGTEWENLIDDPPGPILIYDRENCRYRRMN